MCENTSPSLSLSAALSPRECDDYAKGRLTFASSLLFWRGVKELTPYGEGGCVSMCVCVCECRVFSKGAFSHFLESNGFGHTLTAR